jgi:WD40 repeat protein
MESPTSFLAAAALRSTEPAHPSAELPPPRRRRRWPVVALAIAAALVVVPAARAEHQVVSLMSDGPFPNDPAIRAEFVFASTDGARLFFTTTEVLTGTDTDAAHDGYMRTAAGALVHLTDSPLMVDQPFDAYLDAVSADGTRAFFSTEENLLDSDTDTATVDAYERTPAGALVHLSDDSAAADDNGTEAYVTGVTPDGRHAFVQTEERLAPTDTDNAYDVYERGPAGPIHLSDGDAPDADGLNASFNDASADGKIVYFTSGEKLAASDTDNSADVYRRTAGGALVHVSDDASATDADEEADLRAVSADGTRAWFDTREKLAATDTDTALDVYERRPDGSLVHVTQGPMGAPVNLDAYFTALSADGSRVAFETEEPLAATDTDAKHDVYQRLANGALRHVSDDPTGPDANLSSTYQTMSGDGTRVLFGTEEPLAATDTDAKTDVYERLPNGGLVHISDDPVGPDDAREAWGWGISSDGSRVVFTSDERLAASDTDNAWDAYEYGPGGVRHLTDDPTGPDANVDAYVWHVSADARRLHFATAESLSIADTDTVDDIYLSTAVADPSPPPPPPPAADRVAPSVSKFRVAPSGRVRFALSESADVRIVARRRGARPRILTLADRPAGPNRARLRLRPRGRYRIAITATDAAGNRSLPRRVTLRIVRGPR